MATVRMQSGKWQVRIQRKGHSVLSKTFTNKTDAIKWGRQREAEIERGCLVSPNKATSVSLGEVLARYRHEVTPIKKGAKVEQYRIAVLMRASIATRSLSSIRSSDIAKYRDERSKTVSANTVKNELNTLSAVFEACRMEWDLTVENPVRGLKRPPAPAGRNRRLHPGEFDLLLHACSASRARYLCSAVTVAIETGMRLGEIARIRHEDIDQVRRVVHLADSKNGHPRNVPLSSAALAALITIPANGAGEVFPIHVDTMKQSFRSAVARGRRLYEADLLSRGVSLEAIATDRMLTDLHFHDLRHEAVSRLFERGLNPMEVATISGHKTLGMLKRYTHLRAEDLAAKLG